MKSQAISRCPPSCRKRIFGVRVSTSCRVTSETSKSSAPPVAIRAATRSLITSCCAYTVIAFPPVSSCRSMRCVSPLKRKLMPRWTAPSRRIRSPTPTSTSRSTVPCSSTPARMVDSISARLRASITTDSIPSRCKRCESRSPAGPAPTIPTCVRMAMNPCHYLCRLTNGGQFCRTAGIQRHFKRGSPPCPGRLSPAAHCLLQREQPPPRAFFPAAPFRPARRRSASACSCPIPAPTRRSATTSPTR